MYYSKDAGLCFNTFIGLSVSYITQHKRFQIKLTIKGERGGERNQKYGMAEKDIETEKSSFLNITNIKQ